MNSWPSEIMAAVCPLVLEGGCLSLFGVCESSPLKAVLCPAEGWGVVEGWGGGGCSAILVARNSLSSLGGLQQSDTQQDAGW